MPAAHSIQARTTYILSKWFRDWNFTFIEIENIVTIISSYSFITRAYAIDLRLRKQDLRVVHSLDVNLLDPTRPFFINKSTFSCLPLRGDKAARAKLLQARPNCSSQILCSSLNENFLIDFNTSSILPDFEFNGNVSFISENEIFIQHLALRTYALHNLKTGRHIAHEKYQTMFTFLRVSDDMFVLIDVARSFVVRRPFRPVDWEEIRKKKMKTQTHEFREKAVIWKNMVVIEMSSGKWHFWDSVFRVYDLENEEWIRKRIKPLKRDEEMALTERDLMVIEGNLVVVYRYDCPLEHCVKRGVFIWDDFRRVWNGYDFPVGFDTKAGHWHLV